MLHPVGDGQNTKVLDINPNFHPYNKQTRFATKKRCVLTKRYLLFDSETRVVSLFSVLCLELEHCRVQSRFSLFPNDPAPAVRTHLVILLCPYYWYVPMPSALYIRVYLNYALYMPWSTSFIRRSSQNDLVHRKRNFTNSLLKHTESVALIRTAMSLLFIAVQ